MLSYNDLTLDLDNIIHGNSMVNAIFGNLVSASIVIVLIIIFVFHVNDGQLSKFIYGFIAVFCSLLVVAKILKTQYITKNTKSMDNQFSSWMQSNSSSPVIIPKKSQPMVGSADDTPIDFSDMELVENVGDVDVDNFLYGQTVSDQIT